MFCEFIESIVFKFLGFGSLRRLSSGYADEEDVKVCFFFIDKASIFKRVWFGTVRTVPVFGHLSRHVIFEASMLDASRCFQFAMAPSPGLFWPIDKFETQSFWN